VLVPSKWLTGFCGRGALSIYRQFPASWSGGFASKTKGALCVNNRPERSRHSCKAITAVCEPQERDLDYLSGRRSVLLGRHYPWWVAGRSGG